MANKPGKQDRKGGMMVNNQDYENHKNNTNSNYIETNKKSKYSQMDIHLKMNSNADIGQFSTSIEEVIDADKNKEVNNNTGKKMDNISNTHHKHMKENKVITISWANHNINHMQDFNNTKHHA